MKHLVIRNLGPLKEADVELKRINVIIGSQSSGKSCVLKTACYCTWVEKRIELTQTADFFAKDGNFLKELERFHKLQGYIKPDTFISYESDFMAFLYDNATKTFKFDWNSDFAFGSGKHGKRQRTTRKRNPLEKYSREYRR